MGTQNLSFVLNSKDHFYHEDHDISELNGPNPVANIKETGICGSDSHYWVHSALRDWGV